MKTSGKGLQRLPREPEAHRLASELSVQGKKSTEIRSRLRSCWTSDCQLHALVLAGVKAPGAAGTGLAQQEGTAPETQSSDPEHLGLCGNHPAATPGRTGHMLGPIQEGGWRGGAASPHPPTDRERRACRRAAIFGHEPSLLLSKLGLQPDWKADPTVVAPGLLVAEEGLRIMEGGPPASGLDPEAAEGPSLGQERSKVVEAQGQVSQTPPSPTPPNQAPLLYPAAGEPVFESRADGGPIPALPLAGCVTWASYSSSLSSCFLSSKMRATMHTLLVSP